MALGATLNRVSGGAAALGVINGEETVRALADLFDDRGFIGVVASRRQPRQQSVADAGRRLVFGGVRSGNADHRRAMVVAPVGRFAFQIAVIVNRNNINRQHRRQAPGDGDAFAGFEVD